VADRHRLGASLPTRANSCGVYDDRQENMTIGQVLLKWSIQKGSVPYEVALISLDISADIHDSTPRSN
jgi:hypothetical protein